MCQAKVFRRRISPIGSNVAKIPAAEMHDTGDDDKWLEPKSLLEVVDKTLSSWSDMDEAAFVAGTKGRRVRFQSKATVRICLGRDQYTNTEIRSSWYSRADFAAMYDSCERVVRYASSAGSKSPQYTRGLESLTRAARHIRKKNLQAAYDAVLSAPKDGRWSSSCRDAQALVASRYEESTAFARLWAIHLARQDADEAEIVYNDSKNQIQDFPSLSSVAVSSSTRNITRKFQSLARQQIEDRHH